MKSHALRSTGPYIVDGEFLWPLAELGMKVLVTDSQDTLQFQQLRSMGDYFVEIRAGTICRIFRYSNI